MNMIRKYLEIGLPENYDCSISWSYTYIYVYFFIFIFFIFLFFLSSKSLEHLSNSVIVPYFIRGYIFQKLLLAWNYSCINKNCFFIKETDTFGHIVV